MAEYSSRLHELAARGQSVWFDTLSRDLIHTGELKRMMKDDAVTGVTSNPTIFQKALASGEAYDDDLKKLLGSTDDPTEIFFSLALQDIRDACDVLKPAYDASSGEAPAYAASAASLVKRRPGPRIPASLPAVSALTPQSFMSGAKPSVST